MSSPLRKLIAEDGLKLIIDEDAKSMHQPTQRTLDEMAAPMAAPVAEGVAVPQTGAGVVVTTGVAATAPTSVASNPVDPSPAASSPAAPAQTDEDSAGLGASNGPGAAGAALVDSSDEEGAHLPAAAKKAPGAASCQTATRKRGPAKSNLAASDDPSPPQPPQRSAKRSKVAPPVEPKFMDSGLFEEHSWSIVELPEAMAFGKNVKEWPQDVVVTARFPLSNGSVKWYKGDISFAARSAKGHFWVKFSDGEFKFKFPPNDNYGTTWHLAYATDKDKSDDGSHEEDGTEEYEIDGTDKEEHSQAEESDGSAWSEPVGPGAAIHGEDY